MNQARTFKNGCGDTPSYPSTLLLLRRYCSILQIKPELILQRIKHSVYNSTYSLKYAKNGWRKTSAFLILK